MNLSPAASLTSINLTTEEYKPTGASVIATRTEYMLTNSYAWLPAKPLFTRRANRG